MMFFDWFRGEKRQLELRDDTIWLSRKAKLAGIAEAADACFAEPEPPVEVLLVAHFEDTLGMKEDEPLESHLVTRRIRAAQRKIERLAATDLPAASAEEWMELNCRG